MPNHTVSGNVDTMMRAADNAAIRSAIGVGTTDAPTFLAQTLTGQSLTGTQATSLVDLSATWNTTGNPSLIYGRVTNTNSGTTANLIDLGTFAGGSLFSVTKTGITKADSIQLPGGGNAGSSTISGQNAAFIHIGTAGHIRFWGAGSADMASFKYDAPGLSLPLTGSINWTGSASTIAAATSVLTQDAAGILAQRNGDAAQAFRLYNFYNTAGANYERGEFVWSGNTLFIQAIGAGSGVAQPLSFGGASINFRTSIGAGYVARWNFSTTGHFLAATDNTYDIGASGANRPRSIYVVNAYPSNIQLQSGAANYGWIGLGGIFAPSNGVFRLTDSTGVDFSRLQLGGTTSAFPAIKRSGTGIHIVLADDSTFAPVKGKLTTDTNYTAGVPSATGYLTIYDATGTAYRVPCTV